MALDILRSAVSVRFGVMILTSLFQQQSKPASSGNYQTGSHPGNLGNYQQQSSSQQQPGNYPVSSQPNSGSYQPQAQQQPPQQGNYQHAGQQNMQFHQQQVIMLNFVVLIVRNLCWNILSCTDSHCNKSRYAIAPLYFKMELILFIFRTSMEVFYPTTLTKDNTEVYHWTERTNFIMNVELM